MAKSDRELLSEHGLLEEIVEVLTAAVNASDYGDAAALRAAILEAIEIAGVATNAPVETAPAPAFVIDADSSYTVVAGNGGGGNSGPRSLSESVGGADPKGWYCVGGAGNNG